MNLDNISSGSLGGLIGGGLMLLRDILFGVNKKISNLEKQIDLEMISIGERLDNVVNHQTCEIIREDNKTYMSDMKEDMRYIRHKLDQVISNTQRHRDDYKP